jgi:hypothetical protein
MERFANGFWDRGVDRAVLPQIQRFRRLTFADYVSIKNGNPR